MDRTALLAEGKALVETERSFGATDEIIMRMLLDRGLTAKEIELLLKPVPPPRRIDKATPPADGPAQGERGLQRPKFFWITTFIIIVAGLVLALIDWYDRHEYYPYDIQGWGVTDTEWRILIVGAALVALTYILARIKHGTIVAWTTPHPFFDRQQAFWLSFCAANAVVALFLLGEDALIPWLLILGVVAVLVGFSTQLASIRENERLLAFALLLASAIIAIATFFLGAWLTSFLLAPMREQFLVLTLLPSIVGAVLASEYAYHYWLGEHEKHTLRDRLLSGTIFGGALTLALFIATGTIIVAGTAELQSMTDARNNELNEAITTLTSNTNSKFPVIEDIHNLLDEIPPPNQETKSALFLRYLSFEDMGAATAKSVTRIADGVRQSTKMALYLAPTLNEQRRQEYLVRRGTFYDNTTNFTAHLAELENGIDRLKAAHRTPQEDDYASVSGASPFSYPYYEGASVAENTFQRYLRASSVQNTAFKKMEQLGEDVAQIKKDARTDALQLLTPKEGEPIESTVLRLEVRRATLQDSIRRLLETQQDRRQPWKEPGTKPASETFATEHWQDPYFGVIVCDHLPSESEERVACAARWALAYNDASLCEQATRDAFAETACRAAVVEEENRVWANATQ